MRQLSVGIFDSGIGGLSVLKHAMQELPHENFIFYGDNANAPYGDKCEHEIAELSVACGDFLCQKGVKTLVMACNTATSASVRLLRDKYNIPVVSIEPAVKPALLGEGNVVVLATPATISQSRYNALLERTGGRERVINVPCQGLSLLIEKGDFNSPEIYRYIEKKLRPYANLHVGGVVLGCTHYSFIHGVVGEISKNLFGECKIHNGIYGTVRQLKRILKDNDLLNDSGGHTELYTSGTEKHLELFNLILNTPQALPHNESKTTNRSRPYPQDHLR